MSMHVQIHPQIHLKYIQYITSLAHLFFHIVAQEYSFRNPIAASSAHFRSNHCDLLTAKLFKVHQLD